MKPHAQKDQQWSELMSCAQQGDNESYHELLEEIARVLRSYVANRLLRAGDQAEDLVQEILLTIHRVRHTYDPKRPFAPWMFAIAKHRLMDYFRKHNRKYSKEVYDEELLGIMIEQENELSSDLLGDLKEALQKLPQKQREVIELMKIKGYSVAEVAKATGSSESAVKVNAHRGYKLLRKSLTSTCIFFIFYLEAF